MYHKKLVRQLLTVNKARQTQECYTAGGALSIANLVRVYGLSDDILMLMNECLDGVKEQPATSSGGESGNNSDSNTTQPLAQFGVAKRFRDNDFALHEDQVMYSCGN